MILAKDLFNNHEKIKKQNKTLEDLTLEKYELKNKLSEKISEIIQVKYPNRIINIKTNEDHYRKYNHIIIEIDKNLNNRQLEAIKKLLGFNSYDIQYKKEKETKYDYIHTVLKIIFYNFEVVANEEISYQELEKTCINIFDSHSLYTFLLWGL